jgi:hypothetical protein
VIVIPGIRESVGGVKYRIAFTICGADRSPVAAPARNRCGLLPNDFNSHLSAAASTKAERFIPDSLRECAYAPENGVICSHFPSPVLPSGPKKNRTGEFRLDADSTAIPSVGL